MLKPIFLRIILKTLRTVTDRYLMLPLLALLALPIVINGALNRYLKFYKKINVTLVTVTFGYGQ